MVVRFVVYIGLLTMIFVNPTVSLAAESIVKACIRSQCYISPIMVTPDDQQRGLQGKKKLENNEGMIFEFKEDAYHAFWMQNMNFPIDILWLDSKYRIVYIEHFVPPCAQASCPIYKPTSPARYVLEIKAGESVKHNFRIRDKVELISIMPQSDIENEGSDNDVGSADSAK